MDKMNALRIAENAAKVAYVCGLEEDDVRRVCILAVAEHERRATLEKATLEPIPVSELPTEGV